MKPMASPELRFCMSVDAAHLSRARDQVRVFLGDQGIDEVVAFDVQLCIHEACANAIEHSGSVSDVDVCVLLEGGQISIVVADGGCGLAAHRREQQYRPEMFDSNGRGLYVMSRLMDSLDVHIDGGTEIRMVRRLV
jgi:serine/threonine-protein kinase RsbW